MIEWYTAYDPGTGKILATFTSDAESVPLNTPAGMQCMRGRFSHEDGYVAGESFLPFPERPSPAHVFDWVAKQWVDPRTLEDLKVQQWLTIKAARDEAEFGGFAWDGSVFDSDPQSQSRIQGGVQLATMAAEQPFSIDWTLADNTVRTLSAPDMIAVGVALGAHVQGVHATARALRAQIEAATTAAEVEAISWPTQP